MKTCRPLTINECREILDACNSGRERVLFVLGISVGFRISELLGLTIKDVIDQNGNLNQFVNLYSNFSKRSCLRTFKVNGEARRIVEQYVNDLRQGGATLDSPLFPGRRDLTLSRSQAWRTLKELFSRAGLDGTLATHSLRRTFAIRMYDQLDGDIEKVKTALGHGNVQTTRIYLSHNRETDE